MITFVLDLIRVYIDVTVEDYILRLKWALQIYVCMSMLPNNIIYSRLKNGWL
jgi:hypothetical protein